uniref:E3 ubiquitin-protein ligase ORTHRUS 2-like n=1 Tax=Echinostoma caproni TaxID=27848 RepID=A0A183A1T0_9TREM
LPGDDDDDEIEMDDDALLAYLKAISNENVAEQNVPDTSDETSTKLDLMNALIGEMGEDHTTSIRKDLDQNPCLGTVIVLRKCREDDVESSST